MTDWETGYEQDVELARRAERWRMILGWVVVAAAFALSVWLGWRQHG